MTIDDALTILGQVCAAFVGNLEQHRQVQSAYELVESTIRETQRGSSEEVE